MFNLRVLLLCAVASAFDLRSELQTACRRIHSSFNNSIYIAVQESTLDLISQGQPPTGAADGDRDRSTPGKQQAMPDDLVPGGSITKAFTAVLALQLQEQVRAWISIPPNLLANQRSADRNLCQQGLLDLDAPVTNYIDPWFENQKPPRPPLALLWRNASIKKITSRQLLQMRSGMQDYDDGALLLWTAMQSTPRDYEPLDFILWATQKGFLWPPDEGGSYSGTGYVMLGMVLAAVTKASSWDKLDQVTSAALTTLP